MIKTLRPKSEAGRRYLINICQMNNSGVLAEGQV